MKRIFFSTFFPKCHSAVIKFQGKVVSNILKNAFCYYKSRLPIYFSLILYTLFFIFLILNLTIMCDKFHHRHTYIKETKTLKLKLHGKRLDYGVLPTDLRALEAPRPTLILYFILKLTLLINSQ